ncbi:MarR family transcriptional regulator [Streptomyces durhamensis]|uniref:MarR family transcriptional regulator n=1 Tax=Streptomyces durhamensis TaxID=68194 RepID=UPI001FD785F2|nr:MarR family transcriptional regulator [Streptomyces durhamensis]
MLNLSRTAINAALRDLDLAQLVKKQRAVVYQLNPMLAAYLSPEDAIAAVKAMPKNERLKATDFVDRYRRVITAYQDQLTEKRRRREDAKRRQNLKAVSGNRRNAGPQGDRTRRRGRGTPCPDSTEFDQSH